MIVEPIHLKCSVLPHDDFEPDEKIYHRLHVDNPPVNPAELFSLIQGKNLINKLSVNRSKFSTIQDVMWSIKPIEKDGKEICEYELKGKKICITGFIKDVHNQKQAERTVVCDKSPFFCNKAHCDIVFNPPVSIEEKEVILKLKAYLSSVFTIA
jgi:hypothetical protein